MKRIAVITDIHANLPALDAALAEIDHLGVEGMEYLLEDKAARTFERIAALADCDLLVFGHTHKPWIHEYGGPRFLNYGSVGSPKDGDARGAFAVLDAEGEDVSTSIHRVAYEAPAVALQMRADGLPDELAQKLVAAV